MIEGERVLRDDGYRFVVPVVPIEGDFDAQGHLNNAATVRLFNDLRIAYVQGEVGFEWVELLRRDTIVVAAKEVHVLYESEGFPGESVESLMARTCESGPGQFGVDQLRELVRVLLHASQCRQIRFGDGIFVSDQRRP